MYRMMNADHHIKEKEKEEGNEKEEKGSEKLRRSFNVIYGNNMSDLF